jgi:nucleotide-binding universal stress UspA family protein
MEDGTDLEGGADPRPKKVLVALDLGPGSGAALAVACDLARRREASVVALRAVHLNIVGEERGIPRTRLAAELVGQASEELRQFVENARPDVAVETLAREGRPANVIVSTAREIGAAAIVMRWHGLRGWRSWLHRNTASRVSKEAPCPVWLAVPGTGRASRLDGGLGMSVIEVSSRAVAHA